MKRFIAILLATALAGGITYAAVSAILSGKTFYAEIVADSVASALKKTADLEYSYATIIGNPVTGVVTNNVSIKANGLEIISADLLEMQVDLTSVFSSPKLSMMKFAGLRGDLRTITDSISVKGPSTGAPAVYSVYIEGSEISTPYGVVGIKDLEVELSEGSYNVRGAIKMIDRDIDVDAALASSGGKMSLTAGHITAEGCSISVRGEIVPSLDVSVTAKNITREIVGHFANSVNEIDIDGTVDGEFKISNVGSLNISGQLASEAIQLFGAEIRKIDIPFEYADRKLSISSMTSEAFGAVIISSADIDLSEGSSRDIKAVIEADDLQIKELLVHIGRSDDVKGAADVSCEISGPLHSINGVLKIVSLKFSYEKYDINNLVMNGKLTGSKQLDLEMTGKLLGNGITAAGSFDIKNMKYEIRASGKNIELAKLDILYPQIKEYGVKGLCAAEVLLVGDKKGYKILPKIYSPEINALDKYSLESFAFDASVASSTIENAKAAFRLAGVEIEICPSSGYKIGDRDSRLDLDVRCETSDISKIISLFPNIKPAEIAGPTAVHAKINDVMGEANATATLASSSLSCFKGMRFKSLSADLSYAAQILTINSSSAMFENAKITAAGEITLPIGDKSLAYNVAGSVSSLDPIKLKKIGLPVDDIAGNIDCDLRVWNGDAGRPSLRVYFKNSNIRYADLADLKGLFGSVTYSGERLIFDKLRSKLNSGDLSITGTVAFPEDGGSIKDSTVDLILSARSADIGRLTRMIAPNSKGFEGLLSASCDLKGKLIDPKIDAQADIVALRAFGLFFPRINARNIKGTLAKLDLDQVQARVGRGIISSDISVSFLGEPSLSVTASGRSVDIRSLTHTIDREVRKELHGALDVDFSGSGTLSSFEGSGELRVQDFTGMGIAIKDFVAPFWVNNGFFFIEDSSAKFYNGELKLQIARDITRSRWGGRFELVSVDLAPLVHDILPEERGRLVGTANAMIRFGGDSQRTSLLEGGGWVDVNDIEATGFAAMEPLSRILADRPLRISNAHLPFLVDGENFHMLPGTRLTAPADDLIFRYVTIDGNVSLLDQSMNLSCLGNVNLRALNFMVGGLHSLVSASMSGTSDSSELLQNFLGGALTSFSRNEFRDVSLTLKGTPEDLTFGDIAIAKPFTYETRPEILTDSAKKQEQDEMRFKLTMEIPVGPGVDHRSDVAGQVSGQIFDQIVKGLMKNR